MFEVRYDIFVWVDNYYLAFLYAIIFVLLILSVTNVIKLSKKLDIESSVTRNLKISLGSFTISYLVRIAMNVYLFPTADQFCQSQNSIRVS